MGVSGERFRWTFLEIAASVDFPRRRTSCDEVEERSGPGSQMSAPAPSMESADKGVGALYIVMDAIKRRKAEEKEKAERQREEEEFHNKMNRGRQILPPL